MTEIFNTIDDIIKRAGEWSLLPDGKYLIKRRAFTDESQVLSIDDLTARHPLLPRIVEQIFAISEPAGYGKTAAGGKIQANLQLVEGATYALENYHNETEIFIKILEVSTELIEDKYVSVTGHGLRLADTEGMGPHIPTVTNVFGYTLHSPVEAFEAMYSGWRERIDTAIALGMAPAAIPAYAMRKSSFVDSNVLSSIDLVS